MLIFTQPCRHLQMKGTDAMRLRQPSTCGCGDECKMRDHATTKAGKETTEKGAKLEAISRTDLWGRHLLILDPLPPLSMCTRYFLPLHAPSAHFSPSLSLQQQICRRTNRSPSRNESASQATCNNKQYIAPLYRAQKHLSQDSWIIIHPIFNLVEDILLINLDPVSESPLTVPMKSHESF